jgi:hypothetical protein
MRRAVTIVFIAAAGCTLIGCGSGTSTVALKYLIPSSRLQGPLYIRVSGSPELVKAIRRTVIHAGLRKFDGVTVGFAVVTQVHGKRDCSHRVRYRGGRSTPRALKKFAGQRITLVVFGDNGGGTRGTAQSLFCEMPAIMATFIP